MSNKNQNNFFFQISENKTIQDINSNELISLGDIEKYHSKGRISKLFHKSKYNKLRDSIRKFAKTVNKEIDNKQYDENLVCTLANKLKELKNMTLVLHGVNEDLKQNILNQGRLSIFIKNKDLESINQNYNWGYKTDQINLSKNKITIKRGNSYIEKCLSSNKEDWKKIRKSKTWKLLYNLETKIIKSFGNKFIEENKISKNKSDTLTFSKNEPEIQEDRSIKESKTSINKSDTLTFSKNEPEIQEDRSIEESKTSINKSGTLTFSENEPEIQEDYFQSIQKNEKLSDNEKISKVSEALNNILDKILLAVNNILNNKDSKNELEYIRRFYFSIYGLQHDNKNTLGYFRYIIDIINSINNSESNVFNEMSGLLKNIEGKWKKISKFTLPKFQTRTKEITVNDNLYSVIRLFKERLEVIYRALDEKIKK